MKYIQILTFLITHNTTILKEYWKNHFFKNYKKFYYIILLNKIMFRNVDKYFFWWRLANEMYIHGNSKQKRYAEKINKSLVIKYNRDIMLGAKIGYNLSIGHGISIVIHRDVIIGNDCVVGHNVTIGQNKKDFNVIIGNNVNIGAHSVILGGDAIIGDNVEIGAMSFINKSIPSDSIVYTEKTNKIINKAS